MELEIESIVKLIEKERTTKPSTLLTEQQKINNKKTYLLIDNTPTETSFKLFEKSSKYVIFDGKLLHRKRFIRHIPLGTLLEEYRNILVYAMRHGKVLILRLQEIAVDFLSTFCDEGYLEQYPEPNADYIPYNPYPPYEKWWYLPRGFMLNHGEILIQTSSFPARLYRRNDWNELKQQYQDDRLGPERYLMESEKESESQEESVQRDHQRELPLLISPQFRIVITTTIPIERVEEMLFNGRFGLPAGSSSQFQTFIVK